MNEYQKGDRIILSTGTVFQDSAGTPFDPDVVTFSVFDPSGTTTSYVYGTDANVTTAGTGDYDCAIDVEERGVYLCRVFGETSGGENRGAAEVRFRVATDF